MRKVTPTLRLFIADLTRALAQNNGKVNIRRFIKTWRNEKGVTQVWDSPDLNVTAYIEEGKPQTGQLNPAWVEILMNFPMGWTDIDKKE